MENKIKEIMSVVFETELSMIDDCSSIETIKNWDSLKHMMLIAVLEEEFKITFADDEILDMLSYSSILTILKNKLN
jgi:acyl carrier protein